jgi:predicted MFS family arabinose efflux permease
MSTPLSERSVLFLLGAVQFVNVLDFIMVMPLGPDFARDLDIAPSSLGIVGGAYTASAAAAGIAGAFFLDRFDRRSALALAMLGLAVATLAGALAWDFPSLLAARVAAGLFGGPASALSMSIIADVVPAHRRGRAVGSVMAAFSLASILGVPLGLELARLATWRMPFVAVGLAALVVTGAAISLMPSLRGHIAARAAFAGQGAQTWYDFMNKPSARLMLLATALAMFANFSVIPNLATYVQFNLGYPREQLGTLYLVGGFLSLVAMRIAGPLVDRFGSPAVSVIGSGGLAIVLTLTFFDLPFEVPVVPVFSGFMLVNSFRFVAMNTLASRVPAMHQRARFMSAQSATSHMASACGAMLSSTLLTTAESGALIGMSRVALQSICLTLTLPPLLFLVDRLVRAEQRTGTAEQGVDTAPTGNASGGDLDLPH